MRKELRVLRVNRKVRVPPFNNTFLKVFTRAIVRKPGLNFAEGLTTSDLGKPDFNKALTQHEAYCNALEACGLRVTVLDADNEFPDSTFVEDTAVVIGNLVVLARPGAASRAGEVDRIRNSICENFERVVEITAPGTLDGGDVCHCDDQFLIGISNRTNEDGARQLARFIEHEGHSGVFVDIRRRRDILHLKSGIAHLGDRDLVVWEELADLAQFRGYNLLRVPSSEHYAANCVRVNQSVLVAKGFSAVEKQIERAGYRALPLDVSEFEKMDGDLSCLSLRF